MDCKGLGLSIAAWLAVSVVASGEAAKPATPAAADRWEPAIRAFEAKDRKQPPAKDGVVFVGSSSIVMWDLAKNFPGVSAVNRGFGGSQMADSARYADRIVIPYRPQLVVLYAGDNDLAAGKTPEQVFDDYCRFVAKVHAALPKARIVTIAIKPSRARWKLMDRIRRTNRLLGEFAAKDPRLVFVDMEASMLDGEGKPRAELFRPDGLHLNAEGYRLWSERIRPYLRELTPPAQGPQ